MYCACRRQTCAGMHSYTFPNTHKQQRTHTVLSTSSISELASFCTVARTHTHKHTHTHRLEHLVDIGVGLVLNRGTVKLPPKALGSLLVARVRQSDHRAPGTARPTLAADRPVPVPHASVACQTAMNHVPPWQEGCKPWRGRSGTRVIPVSSSRTRRPRRLSR